ncbi:MAG: hypothetical protein QXD24_08065 [Candidatus Caldarchaeum sp.]
MSETAVEKIRDRYSCFFDGLAERADFQRVLEVVENAVNTAVSDDVAVIGKLIVLSDAEKAVDAFAGFYRRILPPTIVNNLAEDLKWVLNKARETATVLWLEGQRK